MIVKSYHSLVKIQREIEDFIQHDDPGIHNAKFFCLGVTNHWISLVAHKVGKKAEFFLLDSKNRDFLLWSEEDIKSYVSKIREEHAAQGKPAWSDFRFSIGVQSFLDAQFAVRMLMDCLVGNASLLSIEANQIGTTMLQGFYDLFGVFVGRKLSLDTYDEQELRNLPPEKEEVYDQWGQQYQTLIDELLTHRNKLKLMDDTLKRPLKYLIWKARGIVLDTAKL
jgi:hypothetical protein